MSAKLKVIWLKKERFVDDVIKEITNGERRATNVYSLMCRKNIKDLKEGINITYRLWLATKERMEKAKVIRQVAKKTGLSYQTAKYRIEVCKCDPERVCKYKKKTRAKHFVICRKKKMLFTKAVKLATEGICSLSTATLFNVSIYKGLSLQEAFELYIQRMSVKYGRKFKI